MTGRGIARRMRKRDHGREAATDREAPQRPRVRKSLREGALLPYPLAPGPLPSERRGPLEARSRRQPPRRQGGPPKPGEADTPRGLPEEQEPPAGSTRRRARAPEGSE